MSFHPSGEDPVERPEYITGIINGLERYNPEAVGPLEEYLQEQCEQKFCDCNANRTLLKLYQLNPDRLKDEPTTNVLVKAMTQFPSPQFSLALHLLHPSLASPANPATAASTSELHEAIAKLRGLNALLEGADYAQFWDTLRGDDLCVDLISDVAGFEDMIRARIGELVAQSFREIPLSTLQSWLGQNEAATRLFVSNAADWTLNDEEAAAAGQDENGNANLLVKLPVTQENEAKKTDIRENVSMDQFARVLRRSWETAV